MKPLPQDDIRVAKPLYTLRQAAWYLDVAPATLNYWAHETTTRPPLVTVLARKTGQAQTLPFIGFAEAYVVKYALDAGVSRSKIQKAVENMRRRVGGVEHALATDRVRTDGVEIFLELAEAERSSETPEGIEIPGPDQLAIRKMLESKLERIAFAGDGYAERIELPKFKGVQVVADPHVAAGQPLLMSGVGIRVKDILDRVRAGDAEAAVARDFGVKLGEVKELTRHS